MGFLKSAFDFVRSPTYSRTTAVIVLFLIFAAIPLTVIVSQQQQSLRQRATELCTNPDECPDVVKQNGLTDTQCASTPTFTCKITNADKSYDVMGCK